MTNTKKIISLLLSLTMVACVSFQSWALSAVKHDNSGPGSSTENIFDGQELLMLSNQSLSQMESFVITTKNGNLIVVDGGCEADADHLRETIVSKGGRVSAWLITHPHSDHIGALTKIINDGLTDLAIEEVYYNYLSIDWYQENEPARAQTVADNAGALQKLDPSVLHGHVQKGDIIQVDDVKITVMNSPYMISNNAINNSSVVYKMEMGGKTIMFLGDLAYDGGKQFMSEHAGENLHCDIVQMAHHGENGVDKDFYEALSPKIALWCTPQWLWDNDAGSGAGSGNWPTLEVRGWMEQLGVTRNYCIKDGDQTIK